ncbi:glutamine amidotransferase-related protein [Sphingosinicella rhizophila]|uniref:Type 1 glutamine amidotransferase n=1 Tax=Sphingosinicella rhizophila TaxID=3050082 RepID=A0ABU3Q6Y4_9SPHN|nr:type 1 glutamine amidotransferase [Sphingosinicella sp. GR2756]MDT9599168.1 type 1 glutamine amidotransferase [Sphingosinicella sp. GR2756]
MKIGILRTGAPPAPLIPRFGQYDDMFRGMLGTGFDATSYDVVTGTLPGTVEDQDAYLITGSSAGVYEDHDWLPPLRDFLRSAKGKAKLVGICFGHQLMAETFGGRVEKSDRGWGIGLHRYDVRKIADWMDPVPSFAAIVSHQDQVVEPPPKATVLAGSDFTPFGLIAYQDQPAISLQPHPEFEPAFGKALIECRRRRLPDPDAAIASLDQAGDGARLGQWIRTFLKKG